MTAWYTGRRTRRTPSGYRRSSSKTIRDGFAHDGTIREKYNVVNGNAQVDVATGYKTNVVGFGWTNAVYLKMQDVIASGGKSAVK